MIKKSKRFRSIHDSDESVLKIGAVLNKTDEAKGSYQFVVRWFIGEGKEGKLPFEFDTFDLKITKGTRGNPALYLDKEGEWIGQPTVLNVKPKRLAMIDPPRGKPFNGPADDRVTRVATPPTKPVNPAIILSTNLGTYKSAHLDRATKQWVSGLLPDGEGFGVCHLLGQSNASRGQYEAERLLKTRIDHILMDFNQSGKNLPSLFRGSLEKSAVDLSSRYARALVRDGISTCKIKPILFDQLAQIKSSPTQRSWSSCGLLKHCATPAEALANLAILARLANDEPLLSAVDDEIDSRAGARSLIRLKGFSGGRLIDFWCNPEDSKEICLPEARGKMYPGSELIGTGLTIGNFSSEEVNAWCAAGEEVIFTINYNVPPIHVLKAEEGKNRFEKTDFSWDANIYTMATNQLKEAASSGSSKPVRAPASARLGYDLLQSNPGVSINPAADDGDRIFQDALSFGTGNGLIEFVIESVSAKDADHFAFGFNIYGMWEGAPGCAKYFQENSRRRKEPVSAKELAPWLITRRYSYHLDLKRAFNIDPDGIISKNLQEIFNWPPRNAIAQRMDEYTDQTPDKVQVSMVDEKLPSTIYPGKTLWRFDLRTGMGSEMEKYFKGWDPGAAELTSWRNDKDRSLEELEKRPQRYRFWVTSVDPFEQESDPVEVNTADLEAFPKVPKNVFYEPLRRAPLLAPLLGKDSIVCEVAPDGSCELIFNCPLPSCNAMGTKDEGLVESLGNGEAVCRIAIFRRSHSGKKRDVSLPPGLSSEWKRKVDEQKALGWEIFPHVGGEFLADMKFNGELKDSKPWKFYRKLSLADLDYDYVAAINAEVTETKKAFWAPNLSARTAQLRVKKTDGNWESKIATIHETPTISDVVFTNRCSVVNPNPPRTASLATFQAEFLAAKPILAPTNIARDQVLIKLLNVPFTGDEKVGPWRDTEVRIGIGPQNVLDSALGRIALKTGEITDPGDKRFADARKILVRDIAPKSDVHIVDDPVTYKQQQSVGFRGGVSLKWIYDPLSVVRSTTPEAEAVRFDLYQLRVPVDLERTHNSGLGKVNLKFGDNGREVIITFADDNEMLKTALQSAQPLALAVTQSKDNPSWIAALAIVTGIDLPKVSKGMLNCQARVRLVKEQGFAIPSEVCGGYAFAGSLLLEKSVEDSEASISLNTILPVGGGLDEFFCCWLRGVSSLGIVSGHDENVYAERFGLSVQPDRPEEFVVRQPVSEKAEYPEISPRTKPMLPSLIGQGNVSPKSFRLLTSWKKNRSQSVCIALQREARSIYAPELRTFNLSQAYEILKTIETSTEKKFDPNWLQPILPWLNGSAVDSDGVQDEIDMHVPENWKLSASEGMPWKNAGKEACYFDYFESDPDSDNESVMTGSYKYRYRAFSFIELPVSGEGTANYLRSEPTPWSQYEIPLADPVSIGLFPEVSVVMAGLFNPTVVFEFSFGKPQGSSYHSSKVQWLYRVMLLRKMDQHLQLAGQDLGSQGWHRVGQWLEISPEAKTNPLITDQELYRNSPCEAASFEYKIVVEQIIRDEYANDHVVRTSAGEGVSVPITIDPVKVGEYKITRSVKIDSY